MKLFIKSLVTAIFLTGAVAHAQESCKEIFDAPVLPKSILEMMDKAPELDPLFEAASNELYHSKNKVEVVQRTLAKAGVLTEIVVEPYFFGLRRSSYLRILPLDRSYLNRLALRMSDNYGTTLAYDPRPLAGKTVAAYSSPQNRVFVSEYVAITGRPSEDLFHEIKHAALTVREKKNSGSIISGALIKFPGTNWPWGKSKSGYKNVLSLQEVLTWALGAEYYMRAFAQGEVKPHTKKPGRDSFVGAREVYEDARAAVNFHLELAEKDRLKLFYSEANETLSVVTLGWNFLSNYQIPASFFRPRLPGAVQHLQGNELKNYLRGEDGKKVVSELTKDYFRAFDKRLAAAEKRTVEFIEAEKEDFLAKKKAKLEYYDQVVMKGRERERSGEMDRGFYVHKDLHEYPAELQQKLLGISREIFTRRGFLSEKALPPGEPGA